MAESAALQYLRENAGTYPKEELEKQLRAAGYPEAEISSALRDFEQGAPVAAKPPSGFFDFKSKRFYQNFLQKIGDFAFGFFGFLVIGYVFSRILYAFIPFRFFAYGPLALRFFPVLVSLGIFIGAILYFWGKRRWISYGIAATFLVGFLFGGLGLMFLGPALRGFY